MRHGCPRNDGHGGRGVGAVRFGITGSTTLEARPTECAISLVTTPFAGREPNVQNGRLPPGASTVMRRLEPFRITVANGNSSTRTGTNLPAGGGPAPPPTSPCPPRLTLSPAPPSLPSPSPPHPP